MKNTITRRTAFGLGAGLLAAPAIVSAQGNWPTGPFASSGCFRRVAGPIFCPASGALK